MCGNGHCEYASMQYYYVPDYSADVNVTHALRPL
jgi:hypothetical protein